MCAGDDDSENNYGIDDDNDDNFTRSDNIIDNSIKSRPRTGSKSSRIPMKILKYP